jgi:hypothetical protein
MIDPHCLLTEFRPSVVFRVIQTDPPNIAQFNVNLIERGYLGTSAIGPKAALSLEVLTIYHTAKLHSPSLTTEHFARTLRSLHHVCIHFG